MRAAQILADMILEGDAPPVINGVVVVAYGPGLPQEGQYASGTDMEDALAKFMAGNPPPAISRFAPRQSSPLDKASAALFSGYNFFVRDLDGLINFYGRQPVKIGVQGAQILGLTAKTTVAHHIDMTGQELETLPGSTFVNGPQSTPSAGKVSRLSKAPPKIANAAAPAAPAAGGSKWKAELPGEADFLKTVSPTSDLAYTKANPQSPIQLQRANERDREQTQHGQERERAFNDWYSKQGKNVGPVGRAKRWFMRHMG